MPDQRVVDAPILTIDPAKLAYLIHATAWVVAVDEFTPKAAYGTSGVAGMAAVNPPSPRDVESRSRFLEEHYWQKVHACLRVSVAELVDYTRVLDARRLHAMKNTEAKYDAAIKQNRDVIWLAKLGRNRLAVDKLFCDVFLAIASPPYVSIPYGLAMRFIHGWPETRTGLAVALAKIEPQKITDYICKESADVLVDLGREKMARTALAYLHAATRAFNKANNTEGKALFSKVAMGQSISPTASEGLQKAVAAEGKAALWQTGSVALRGAHLLFVVGDIKESLVECWQQINK
jgi:hypothetical protein